MKELDLAVLMRAIPEFDLVPGDVGTVVLVHRDGEAYEVEFLTRGGRTIAVLTLEADDIRPIGSDDLLHVRQVAA